MVELPEHLKKYQVEQNYSKYTPVDQATWRYVLRQLKDFLSRNAHSCYLEGLEKTGLNEDLIPKISEMSEKLKKFGWTAIPVSGFIPPAAFMELQSLSVLPIASDMRSLDHLLYTPAPDIVHEAAGHAPILIDPEYADYLKEYAQIAKKAIISKEDLDIYEAIRDLSDVKENPTSTSEQILASEKKLHKAISESTHVSEATELSRMNWWTAEYGLIGSLDKPKIFGAGLLSSIGESRWCLSDKVKKIPLTVECIKQTYDITEPQPQLYVAENFKKLVSVLHQMADGMAYKIGGEKALDKLIQAKTVNTAELNTGLQISGVLDSYLKNEKGEAIYLKFTGPTQISFKDNQLQGHSKNYHQHGYSFPLGPFSTSAPLAENTEFELKYISGVVVKGLLAKITTVSSNALIYTFKNATAVYKNEILFKPEWGDYDITVGDSIKSAFGGPADRKNYGDTDDFVASRIPPVQYSEMQRQIFSYYQQLRNLRDSKKIEAFELESAFNLFYEKANTQWLLFVELLELTSKNKDLSKLNDKIQSHLLFLKSKDEKISSVIDDGIRLAHA